MKRLRAERRGGGKPKIHENRSLVSSRLRRRCASRWTRPRSAD